MPKPDNKANEKNINVNEDVDGSLDVSVDSEADFDLEVNAEAPKTKAGKLLQSYDAMRVEAMNDFADDYDLRLDGINNEASTGLNQFVDDLIDLQKDAAANKLSPEEQADYDKLISKMQGEQEMTSVHKMLQYKMLSALLESGAGLDEEGFRKAVECQELYNAITTEAFRENHRKEARNPLDDGSLQKTELRTVEALLEREQKLDKHPLTDVCQAVIDNRKEANVGLLFDSDLLRPYMRSCLRMRNMKAEESAMREEPVSEEEQRLENTIDDMVRQAVPLKKKFDEEQKNIAQFRRETGISKEEEESIKNSAYDRQKLLYENGKEVNELFKSSAKSIKAKKVSMDRHTELKAERSREFLNMKRTLTSLVKTLRTGKKADNKKADIKDQYKDIVDAYNVTTAYIRKRKAGSFLSRCFGESGKRYKRAVETRRILKHCCKVYKDFQELSRRAAVAKASDEATLEELKKVKEPRNRIDKELRKIENRRDELRGNLAEMKKAGKKGINFRKLEEKLDMIEMPEKHRGEKRDHGNVKKKSAEKTI